MGEGGMRASVLCHSCGFYLIIHLALACFC